MDKVKNAIIEDFEKSIEAWRGLATKDNMFLIGRIDAYEMAIETVKYMFKTVGTGHWVEVQTVGDTVEWQCSECKHQKMYTVVGEQPNYCPHCGAKMVKEDE